MGVKFGMQEGTQGPLLHAKFLFGMEERTEGPLVHAKFNPHRCNDKGVGPQNKWKFLLRFDRNVEYKRPAGA